MFGASTLRIFWNVLVPLLAPGILAASLLVLVRTIAMFELTFLTAGSDSQTLVVALTHADWDGRYLAHVLPLIYTLAGAGAVSIAQRRSVLARA